MVYSLCATWSGLAFISYSTLWEVETMSVLLNGTSSQCTIGHGVFTHCLTVEWINEWMAYATNRTVFFKDSWTCLYKEYIGNIPLFECGCCCKGCHSWADQYFPWRNSNLRPLIPRRQVTILCSLDLTKLFIYINVNQLIFENWLCTAWHTYSEQWKHPNLLLCKKEMFYLFIQNIRLPKIQNRDKFKTIYIWMRNVWLLTVLYAWFI